LLLEKALNSILKAAKKDIISEFFNVMYKIEKILNSAFVKRQLKYLIK
jgi:hypothetical protein